MKTKLLAAAAALAMTMAASAASATTYFIDTYAAGFQGTLGTVTVTGEGTSTLSFDVFLNPNVAFQQLGNGNLHDALWFDLTGVVGAITSSSYTFTAPAPTGSFPNGGQFSGTSLSTNNFGQGGFAFGDYAVQVQDSITPPVDYYSGHLTFTVTSLGGSLNLASNLVGGETVFGAGDFRQTLAGGTVVTGPAGFTLGDGNTNNNVPEPATWALMIAGFGGVGALMRRRRMAFASL